MSRYASRLVLAVILISTLIFTALQVMKWRDFGYNGLDLAIYTNTVHHLAFNQTFGSSIHDPSYLGDHLEVGLIPLAAIYRLAPTGLTLLLVQTLVITGTAWLVWIFFRRLLGWQAGLLGVVLWLIHPIIYNLALYEFHGLVFAWPLLWWSIIAYQQKKQWQWWVSLGLLCLVREDVPLVVLGWAVLAAVDRRGWRWWVPALVAGGAWFLIAQGIIGAHNPDDAYKYLVFYRWAGSTPWEVLTVPFRHPIIFLSHIFQGYNWQTVLGLLLAGGGLAIFRWRRLIPLVFVFAQLLMLGTQPESILRIHYTVPYLPFLLWASAEAWLAVRERKLWSRYDQQIVLALASIVVIVGPLYAHLLYGPLELPWTKRTNQGASHPAILAAAAAEVRANDRVITTFNFLPNLANRDAVYSLNYLYLGRRQYSDQPYTIPTDVDVAIIDWQQLYQYQFLYRETLYENRTGAERIRDLLLDQNLALVWWRDGVAVYRRGGSEAFEPTTRIPITTVSGQVVGPVHLLQPPIVHPTGSETINRKSFSIVPISWQWYVAEKITAPVSIRFLAIQNEKIVWNSTRLLGQGVYPAVDWPVGSAWLTQYLLSVPADVTGRIELRAEITELEGRYSLDRVRSFTPVIRREKILARISLGSLTLTDRSR